MGWELWVVAAAVVVALVVMHLTTQKIRRTIIEYCTIDLEVIREMRLLLQDMQSIRPELDETIENSLAILGDQERKVHLLLRLAGRPRP